MVPGFQSKLRFQDDGGLPFTLLSNLIYITKVYGGSSSRIVVPDGFKTDLASIPRLFWRVLPPIGKYDAAAVVHDYLYQHNGVTRAQADAVLNEGMQVLGVSGWQRSIIYAGVRVGGWAVWNRYRSGK